MTAPLTAAAIRRQFLDFFVERGHREVPSAPVFPQDDPTLLFTNAGMNQFKDVFLGTGKRDYTRAVDTQKCIRVSGKHNDLEEVGVDTYHHTFFEMLGNWSFGDYFKGEAIPWAWELLTVVWGLPKDRLWVTVFAGDEKDGLPVDSEAERIWKQSTDIDPARVLRCGREDNFWEMGETGPCGPCTEIHYDRGAEGCDLDDGANPEIGVNAGNERFIEIWNNVFMEFNRLDDGSLKQLPALHVDTGMGFERITSILQGKRSNYDTDLFTPLFRSLEEISGRDYGRSMDPGDEGFDKDVAFRVCADHVRAVSAAFADGALPSNTGRGYVLRRLIRRAARYGRQQLGLEEPFLYRMLPSVAEALGSAFPEIPERADHVELLIKEEEKSFGRTLGRGLVQFEKLTSAGRKTLPGDEVYDLYATYGFPQDLVELMARERGLEVDLEGWSKAQREHQAASRSEGSFKQLLSAEQLEGLPETRCTYHAMGDEGVELETSIVRSFGAGDSQVLVLQASPFYPEAGGQVGDTGTIQTQDGTFRFEVTETRRLGGIVAHIGRGEGVCECDGKPAMARVDADRRERTKRNHTATHLMHKALRDVLGDHVTQQGSYVGPDRLRFDLSHPRAIEAGELERIEAIVNAQVLTNAAVETTEEALEDAKQRGVTALFGEKYDDVVRVVDVGGWSTELCGGTHVHAAGDIGPFVIVSEGAIQAGVRRIEALTGATAIEQIQAQRRLLRQTALQLKVKDDEVPERVGALQKQLKDAKKAKAKAASADVGSKLEDVRAACGEQGGVNVAVLDLPDLDRAGLGELIGRVSALGADHAVALFGRDGDKAAFVVACQGAALERGLKAGDLAKAAAGVLGGGGGGRPQLAQGQGQKVELVGEACEAVRAAIDGALA